MNIAVTKPYQPRRIRFVEQAEIGEWRVKLYGASHRRSGPRQTLLQETKRLAADVLPRPAVGQGRYGIAFACTHEGRDGGCYSMIDWWADENELHHQLFIDFEPAPQEALTACVWDIAIMAFERGAWIEHMLTEPGAADVNGYLAATLNADV